MNAPPQIDTPDFAFDSKLAEHAVGLERLCTQLEFAAMQQPLLNELGELMRFTASIASARIEGNRTTVVEVIDGAQAGDNSAGPERVTEVLNLEAAAAYLNQAVQPGTPITHKLIRELHAIVVKDLIREGDELAGQYRVREVQILGSDHTPPLAATVHAQLDELLQYVNANGSPHLRLLKMAIAHHRFVWIHPFTNGNGRVARLFSYAVLRSLGFTESAALIINPTGVFGSDRQAYYRYLQQADALDNAGLSQWCLFVLGGMRQQLEDLLYYTREDQLSSLVRDAISLAVRSGVFSVEQAQMLNIFADASPHKAADFSAVIPGSPAKRSRILRSLLGMQVISPASAGARFYVLKLSPNALTPFVLNRLDAADLLPAILRD